MPKPIWISAKDAALFLSAKYGRRITDQHVRDYARQGDIDCRPVDGRTNEYNRRDVEKLEIRPYRRKPTKEPKPEDAVA